MSFRKKTTVLFVLIATMTVAWLLGTQAGNLVTQSKKTDYQIRRQAQTKQILEQMGTMKVGDTLADFALEDLHLNLFRLSELSRERTLITFFQPDCAACMKQIELMQELEVLRSHDDLFVFISSSNPLYLKAMVESEHFPWKILFDSDKMVQDSYSINFTPFSVVTGSDLVVRQIIIGIPTKEEILSIIE